ncbi:MAG: sulfur carrier protein ThiS [Actinobacteria bacterium]|nr:MAG: sulfur carrier protein ThiS [Actinomycetota bacterium]
MGALNRLTLNGAPSTVDAGSTVGSLVDASVPDRRGVAVAVNDEVVPRSQWDRTHLSDGDRVEILTAAKGG